MAVCASTIVDLLRARADQRPEDVVFRFLKDGEVETEHLTSVSLDLRARSIAAALEDRRIDEARAVLLYPASLDFICAFFGCLYAGLTAVPVYPIEPGARSSSVSRFQAIVASAGPQYVLTTTHLMDRLKPAVESVQSPRALTWIATDTINTDLAEAWKDRKITADALAFLQYTSGSTNDPKGVMVSHGNIFSSARLMQARLRHTETGTMVSWLPHYHDMGLVGGILWPLYVGMPSILMAPEAFLYRPARWLQAISRYRATVSAAPNFAYEMAVERVKPEQRTGLDLSSWYVAVNGAEPVRAETMRRFGAAFQSNGFRPETFYPCYGMAEATLMIAGKANDGVPTIRKFQGKALEQSEIVENGPDDAHARSLVGCGPSLGEHRIVIADPESLRECLPGRVGEIWVSGPGVAQGYWNHAESDAYFHACLADTGQGPFLRTGDLGFIRDGEIFVAGRLKELVISDGRNYYPQDIEQVVERSHPALRSGHCVAFSVDTSSREEVVVIAEASPRRQRAVANLSREGNGAVRSDLQAIVQSIRAAVAQECGLRLDRVVLVAPGTITKTSSGKLQRTACRNSFLSGNIQPLDHAKEASE